MKKITKQEAQYFLKNRKEEICLCISLNISIFPISFIINSRALIIEELAYGGMKNLKDIFALVMFSALASFVFISIFTLNSYIKEKATKYYIFFVLGIKNRDFWKAIYKDFFKIVFSTGILSTILCNLVSIGLIITIEKNKIAFKTISRAFFMTTGGMLILFTLVMIGVSGILYYWNRKKEMLEFWNNINNNTEFTYNSKIRYFVKPVLGIFICILTIICCMQYKTLYWASVLQFISAYFIISSNECLRYINQTKKYKSILSLNAIINQYGLNTKLIVSMYLLNFISVFIIGGFILSGITQRESDNFEARYPYGYIIWGDEINLQEKYTYHFLQAETEENKKAIIFSTSTYEDITKNEISVSDGKIVYISQRSRETFEPLEGKAQLNIIVNNNMKTYDIETSRWQIIFGDSISPELTNVIIMNDKDYEKIKKNESEIYLGNTAENLTEENTHKWMRKEAIRTEREGNDYVVFIMYIIGIMLIFEEQGIVLIKQILNRSRILYKYNLLYILGIQNKDLKKFFFNEIKTIAIFPLVSGSLVGMFFLCLDIFYQNDFTWDVLNLCLSLCGIMILVQYLGFRCISTLLFKIYNIGRTER